MRCRSLSQVQTAIPALERSGSTQPVQVINFKNMGTKTQHGYLILADISGYSAFIAESELEHAHDILSELLELVLKHITTLFTFNPNRTHILLYARLILDIIHPMLSAMLP